MKKSLNPMKHKSMEPKRPSTSGPKSRKGGSKFGLSATAPKYGVSGGDGDTVVRKSNAAGPKSKKTASHFKLGSNASGGYGVRGVSGPSKGGNYGTRGM